MLAKIVRLLLSNILARKMKFTIPFPYICQFLLFHQKVLGSIFLDFSNLNKLKTVSEVHDSTTFIRGRPVPRAYNFSFQKRPYRHSRGFEQYVSNTRTRTLQKRVDKDDRRGKKRPASRPPDTEADLRTLDRQDNPDLEKQMGNLAYTARIAGLYNQQKENELSQAPISGNKQVTVDNAVNIYAEPGHPYSFFSEYLAASVIKSTVRSDIVKDSVYRRVTTQVIGEQKSVLVALASPEDKHLSILFAPETPDLNLDLASLITWSWYEATKAERDASEPVELNYISFIRLRTPSTEKALLLLSDWWLSDENRVKAHPDIDVRSSFVITREDFERNDPALQNLWFTLRGLREVDAVITALSNSPSIFREDGGRVAKIYIDGDTGSGGLAIPRFSIILELEPLPNSVQLQPGTFILDGLSIVEIPRDEGGNFGLFHHPLWPDIQQTGYNPPDGDIPTFRLFYAIYEMTIGEKKVPIVYSLFISSQEGHLVCARVKPFKENWGSREEEYRQAISEAGNVIYYAWVQQGYAGIKLNAITFAGLTKDLETFRKSFNERWPGVNVISTEEKFAPVEDEILATGVGKVLRTLCQKHAVGLGYPMVKTVKFGTYTNALMSSGIYKAGRSFMTVSFTRSGSPMTPMELDSRMKIQDFYTRGVEIFQAFLQPFLEDGLVNDVSGNMKIKKELVKMGASVQAIRSQVVYFLSKSDYLKKIATRRVMVNRWESWARAVYNEKKTGVYQGADIFSEQDASDSFRVIVGLRFFHIVVPKQPKSEENRAVSSSLLTDAMLAAWKLKAENYEWPIEFGKDNHPKFFSFLVVEQETLDIIKEIHEIWKLKPGITHLVETPDLEDSLREMRDSAYMRDSEIFLTLLGSSELKRVLDFACRYHVRELKKFVRIKAIFFQLLPKKDEEAESANLFIDISSSALKWINKAAASSYIRYDQFSHLWTEIKAHEKPLGIDLTANAIFGDRLWLRHMFYNHLAKAGRRQLPTSSSLELKSGVVDSQLVDCPRGTLRTLSESILPHPESIIAAAYKKDEQSFSEGYYKFLTSSKKIKDFGVSFLISKDLHHMVFDKGLPDIPSLNQNERVDSLALIIYEGWNAGRRHLGFSSASEGEEEAIAIRPSPKIMFISFSQLSKETQETFNYGWRVRLLNQRSNLVLSKQVRLYMDRSTLAYSRGGFSIKQVEPGFVIPMSRSYAIEGGKDIMWSLLLGTLEVSGVLRMLEIFAQELEYRKLAYVYINGVKVGGAGIKLESSNFSFLRLVIGLEKPDSSDS